MELAGRHWCSLALRRRMYFRTAVLLMGSSFSDGDGEKATHQHSTARSLQASVEALKHREKKAAELT